MEEALSIRLKSRQQNLMAMISNVQDIMDKGSTVGIEELTRYRVALKGSIETYSKETYMYLEKSEDSQRSVDMSSIIETQLKAEEILSYLDTFHLLAQSSPPTTQATSRLPKLDLIKYNGDILKWPEFWDRFQATVGTKAINDVDKLSYLMESLEGEALDTVAGLATTNDNYAIALDVLKTRYGGNDRVIDAHYDAINKLTPARNVPGECRRTLNLVEKHLRVLSTLNENIDSSHLRVTIANKFPGAVLYQVKLLSKDNNVQEMRASLEKVVTAMEQSEQQAPPNPNTTIEGTSTEVLHVVAKAKPKKYIEHKKDHFRKPNQWDRKRKSSDAGEARVKRQRKECTFCKEAHFSDQCTKFATLEARKGELRNKCFVCFKVGHSARKCFNASKQRCPYCQKGHNRALCPKKLAGAPSEIHSTPTSVPREPLCLVTNVKSCLQTATVHLKNNNLTIPCRLLLDSGSQRSYITKNMAKQLNLALVSEDLLVIFTFGSDIPHKTSSPAGDVKLVTKRGIEREIRVNVVPHITDRIPILKCNAQDLAIDILADDSSVGEGIDLLIGNDYYFSFIKDERVRLQENLYLIDTELGWIISGNYNEEEENELPVVITYCQCHEPGCPYFSEPDLPLRTVDMKFLWALESIGITDSPKTTREEEAVKHFNETVIYCDGRYNVKWPWIDYPPELPTNFGLAYGRLKGLLKRSDKDTIQDYQDILNEQLETGIIEVVDSEPKSSDAPIHYLPHHIVKQKGKRGRIVYDASAKCQGQKSLNECLYRGPSMIEDMTALILQFRTGKIGITADVEKAFLQVGLQEDDREVTRFLWVRDPSKEVSEDNLLHLRFRRVPFGVISSPFLLTATIRYHFSQTNQSLLKKIADRCYVDNLVTNANSISEAKEVFCETKQAFGELSMKIRDWTSNSHEFLESIPETLRAKKMDQVKVLGLLWNLENDTLQLKLTEDMFESKVVKGNMTKKDVLRMLARFYDPCGFIAPLILPAKLLFQELCAKGIKWDTTLPDELKIKWDKLVDNLQASKSIRLQRYAGTENVDSNTKYELHSFTDASKNSYAAVVYLRTTTKDETSVSFLMSKSRVTPVEDKDDLKIPRLELLGYLIGNRLLKYVRDNINLPIHGAFLWTDSLIVLSWLKSSKLLPPFVSRRVSEIKQNKDVEFRHVSTSMNPADLATRPELWNQKKDLWFNGPIFLSLDHECWPTNTQPDAQATLFAAGEALDVVDGPEMVMKGYEDSSQCIETEVPTSTENLDLVNDVPAATDTVLRDDIKKIKSLQAEHFPDEIAGKETNLTRNLGLFIDVDGLLRCKGRMSNADWTYEKKHPVLIPRNCSFTNDVIRRTHEANYHVGVPHTLSIIRQKYWIPQGRAEVQKILKKCTQCVKYGGGPYQLPPTPSLPAERVNFSAPFTYTGLDYFGPMFVNTESGKEKRWICLFTCLAVRAIHMEVVKNLTAEECLLALRRFIATRGVPVKIVSDNALQFKLSSEVLSKPYCRDCRIQWQFIPQLAPWHGGFYERLVALVKHCLKRTLDKHLLQDTQLLTVIKEVESVLNTRPLVRVGADVEQVLKPSDFLTLGRCIEVSPGNTDLVDGTNTKIDLVQGWRRGQMILEEFKRMFQDQYLPSLRERYRHSCKQPRVKSQREPCLGDLVQIKDESNKNRGSWKVGRITSLIKGRDGECRVARVKVGNSEFTRSIAHLYPLENDMDHEDKETRETIPNVDLKFLDHTEPEKLPEVSLPDQTPTATNDDIICDFEGDIVVSNDLETPQPPELELTSEEVNTGELSPSEMEVNEVLCDNETVQCEDKTGKRVAAIRAREKIAEWTRQLFVLLK